LIAFCIFLSGILKLKLYPKFNPEIGESNPNIFNPLIKLDNYQNKNVAAMASLLFGCGMDWNGMNFYRLFFVKIVYD